MIWSFLLYLFIALQVAALIGGIISRLAPLKPQQLVWRGVTVERASLNIQQFFHDLDDGRFAYPTGQFVPDPETNLADGHVVMTEQNFSGSKGFKVLFGLFLGVRRWMSRTADESLGVALIGGFIGFWIAGVIALPFLIASVIDIAYRALYRSQITATVKKHPDIDQAVTIDLSFRGLSAFGILGDALSGMGEPSPPVGSKAYAAAQADVASTRTGARAAAQWTGSAERRSSVIYGTGIAVSLLVAAMLTAFVPTSSTSYADDSYSSGSSSSPSSGSSGSSSGSSSSDDDTESSGSSSTEEESEAGYTALDSSFSVSPVAGWIQDSEQKDKREFEETRWHEPGNSDVKGLVDHTAGYSGSAREGAEGQRDNWSKVDDYVEYDFSETSDGGIRWEFAVGGNRKVDVFYGCPDGGYAVLAAAPEDQWSDYETDLNYFVDSFTVPGCNDGDSQGGASSDSSDTSDESSSEPTFDAAVDGAQRYDTSTTSGKMERAIRGHWNARLNGDYSSAYGYYTNPIKNRVGLESRWTQEISEDGLQDVSITAVKSTAVSTDSGKIDVSLDTESDANGCMSWDFHYTMVHRDGRWLIADSKADKSSC